MSNHTLVCFHSKRVVRTPDGRLQATGELTVTRVDRNVEAEPTEAYSGPVYGPPMIHRVSHEATFIFDIGDANGSEPEREQSPGVGIHDSFPRGVSPVSEDRSQYLLAKRGSRAKLPIPRRE